MNKTNNEPLTSEQITDARRLCEVIKGVTVYHERRRGAQNFRKDCTIQVEYA